MNEENCEYHKIMTHAYDFEALDSGQISLMDQVRIGLCSLHGWFPGLSGTQ
jgi:hypothetical protein